mmetsp:Transcript_33134/g.72298  ORF Transcript_33134/g.72298 Transcript_33134/m.72298 type:complete len:276 (+) Transcript_33134:100-927(+)
MCLYRRPHRLASAHLSGSVRIRANLFVDEGDQTTDVANVDQGIIVLKVENISVKDFHEYVRIANRCNFEGSLHAFQHAITVSISLYRRLDLLSLNRHGRDVSGPEEMGTQCHHAALIRLLQQLVGVLSRLGNQGFIILSGEVTAIEQSANDIGQGSHLSLAIRDFALVNEQTLLHEFVGDCGEVTLVSSLGGLQEQIHRDLGVRSGHSGDNLNDKLEHFTRTELRRGFLIFSSSLLASKDSLRQRKSREDKWHQSELDALCSTINELCPCSHKYT